MVLKSPSAWPGFKSGWVIFWCLDSVFSNVGDVAKGHSDVNWFVICSLTCHWSQHSQWWKLEPAMYIKIQGQLYPSILLCAHRKLKKSREALPSFNANMYFINTLKKWKGKFLEFTGPGLIFTGCLLLDASNTYSKVYNFYIIGSKVQKKKQYFKTPSGLIKKIVLILENFNWLNKGIAFLSYFPRGCWCFFLFLINERLATSMDSFCKRKLLL